MMLTSGVDCHFAIPRIHNCPHSELDLSIVLLLLLKIGHVEESVWSG